MKIPLNEDLTIVIPTKGRVDSQKTLETLPNRIRKRVVLVCPTSERKDLRRAVRSIGKVQDIIARPKSLEKKSISDIRQWIVMNAIKTKYFLFMDDDIAQFCQRTSRTTGKPVLDLPEDRKDLSLVVVTSTNEIVKVLNEFTSLCRTYPVGGISSRMFNNGLTSKNGLRMNTKVWGVWGGRTAWFKKNVDMSEVPSKEDYHSALVALTKGYSTFCIAHMSFDTKSNSYNAAGGCSEERAKRGKEFSKIENTVFAKRWKKWVKLVERQYKTGSRTEVIVRWQQAYAHGKAKREKKERT